MTSLRGLIIYKLTNFEIKNNTATILQNNKQYDEEKKNLTKIIFRFIIWQFPCSTFFI